MESSNSIINESVGNSSQTEIVRQENITELSGACDTNVSNAKVKKKTDPSNPQLSQPEAIISNSGEPTASDSASDNTDALYNKSTRDNLPDKKKEDELIGSKVTKTEGCQQQSSGSKTQLDISQKSSDKALAPGPVLPAPLPGVGGGSKMREIRERAKLRRQLVAQQLGVWCPDRLGEALGNRPSGSDAEQQRSRGSRHRRHLSGHASQTVALYTDSTTFLKGTQSANPHNDYCQHFVDTGHRPQNFIRDVGLADRFEEYPKLRELIKLKDDLIATTASPPCYLKADLHNFPLSSLQGEFDVILVEPPLEEYQHTAPGHTAQLQAFWDWSQIRELDIAQVAAPRSFIFLWVGSSEGLDEGRRCLRSWGFRRCEDICWIRTNSTRPGHSKNLDHKAVFQRTKEHCLMGIKGTVRRSTDGDFIHANVDIDLIITEEGSTGTLDKPVEIFHIIEHFCLGKRRLHLFGRDHSIRPGWLTVGPDLSSTNFDPSLYSSYFNPKSGGNLTTGCTDRIEALRPKSPPPKPGGKTRGGYARGRGRGR